ncbi:hypothetical protein AB9P05_12830 [Roseivirga sp. BDSF3-8]|uniref:hypothetical protein n=1 Tax=Roseivirga sp. BDSF3-8 TaxID=3241598 RepID=UPI003532758D
MDLVMQFLLFFVLIAGSFAFIGGLFWLLFKKDAPPVREIERRLQQKRHRAQANLYV